MAEPDVLKDIEETLAAVQQGVEPCRCPKHEQFRLAAPGWLRALVARCKQAERELTVRDKVLADGLEGHTRSLMESEKYQRRLEAIRAYCEDRTDGDQQPYDTHLYEIIRLSVGQPLTGKLPQPLHQQVQALTAEVETLRLAQSAGCLDEVHLVATVNLPLVEAERARLREALKSLWRTEHDECQDCWYSCPKSGNCCNDNAGDNCTCGADATNVIIDTALESQP